MPLLVVSIQSSFYFLLAMLQKFSLLLLDNLLTSSPFTTFYSYRATERKVWLNELSTKKAGN